MPTMAAQVDQNSTAENDNGSTLHASAVRMLSDIPTLLLHAVEALSNTGEEGGALDMIERATAMLSSVRLEIEQPKAFGGRREPDPQFISKGCPEGTDTILGFLARCSPDLLDFMPDPVSDIQNDHAGLRLMTRQGGQEPTQVPASPAVRESRRQFDWAYPVEHLASRYL